MEEQKPKRSTFKADEARWLAENWGFLLENYAGMWVAVHGSALVGDGQTLAQADEAAAGDGFNDSLFDVIPRREYRDIVLLR